MRILLLIAMLVSTNVYAQQYTDVVVTNDDNIIVTEYVEKYADGMLCYTATKGYNLHVFDKTNELVGVYIDMDTPEKHTRFTIHDKDTVAVFMFSPKPTNNWCNDWSIYIAYLENILPHNIAVKIIRLSRTALSKEKDWWAFQSIVKN